MAVIGTKLCMRCFLSDFCVTLFLMTIITGDQLAIAKETGRRLGMGTNMYPSSSLLGENKDESVSALPVDELIEKADGFAGVFPGNSYFYIDSFMIIFFHSMKKVNCVDLSNIHSDSLYPQSISMRLCGDCKIESTSVE